MWKEYLYISIYDEIANAKGIFMDEILQYNDDLKEIKYLKY